MKNRLFFVFIMLLCGMQMLATSLVIERTSGADMVLDVAAIGKWVFVGNEIQLMDKSGAVLATEVITNVRKISFVHTPTAVESVEKNTLVIYPNPTQDILYINGIEAQALRVYDLQGRMLKMTIGTEVDVAELPLGTYLLQIGTQVVRFIKK